MDEFNSGMLCITVSVGVWQAQETEERNSIRKKENNMKTTIKMVSLLALVAVLVLSITSVAQAAKLKGIRVICPGPYGRACVGCFPGYSNQYRCLSNGEIAEWNSNCTWYSALTILCANPAVCHCLDAEHNDHCASSCAYR